MRRMFADGRRTGFVAELLKSLRLLTIWVLRCRMLRSLEGKCSWDFAFLENLSLSRGILRELISIASCSDFTPHHLALTVA